ncbi:DUF572-domain-containing protein [Fistulina hepatica ATCC 64428]|uniref:DUF572-domain-containing protein n=1 Tax=Fistulina hepatica ATCC 64428 TaxID=1128425 RepID=A0A0D7A743_9AGAR|nr:DUF572-domain-containing protein [Fistulina hepatica ATCC 64428]
MQGFNKYYPPDYDDEKHKSLNAYHGKHALGDRARKLDKGILITRFELPFNIWCGTCNNHIGMGVRYNAEKKKIGNYYSTPIYSFRCKCHLCDGWFEIQTDPKNTRYVVVSGARQKDEDWDPEENGGFAIHDTDSAAAPVDPLAALEKTTDAQNNLTKVQMPRIEELQHASEHYNADPYMLSVKARNHFREEKKIESRKRETDNAIRDRYALPETLHLADEGEVELREAKEAWMQGRLELEQRQSRATKRQKLAGSIISSVMPSGSSAKASSSRGRGTSLMAKTAKLNALQERILGNTARRSALKRPQS